VKAEAQCKWSGDKSEVVVCREFRLLQLGNDRPFQQVIVPAGTRLRVIRRIASDAAEVEWKGSSWAEIFIGAASEN
jgi:hypothetical protein